MEKYSFSKDQVSYYIHYYDIPNHKHGRSTLVVVDALRGKDRESQYEAKYKGRSLTEEQLGFHKVTSLPSDRIPYLIDNVVDTGTTVKAAVKALGGGIVLSYAMSYSIVEFLSHNFLLLSFE